ncbi:MAG: hypothetical protein ACREXR_01565, partial [Gammaproteobacteria bacterium]
ISFRAAIQCIDSRAARLGRILFWIETESFWRDGVGLREEPQKLIHVELEKVTRIDIGARIGFAEVFPSADADVRTASALLIVERVHAHGRFKIML